MVYNPSHGLWPHAVAHGPWHGPMADSMALWPYSMALWPYSMALWPYSTALWPYSMALWPYSTALWPYSMALWPIVWPMAYAMVASSMAHGT